jgi:hypothetical protein
VDFIALCAPLLLLGLTFALDHVERWLTAPKPKTRATGRLDGDRDGRLGDGDALHRRPVSGN